MPPYSYSSAIEESLKPLFHRATEEDSGVSLAKDYLSAQWRNPGDILSVLLLLGPDIVQSAIAQLAGRRITPVAFSFGWVSYAVAALVSSIGDGVLMPDANVDSTVVIGAHTGHARTTKSWVLCRLLRDFDSYVDDNFGDEQTHTPEPPAAKPKDDSDKEQPKAVISDQNGPNSKAWEALRITVFKVDPNPPVPHGVPTLDWVWYSGFIVVGFQLGIAIAPWAAHGQWDTFMVTFIGILVAFVSGSLPQWKEEKWACPKNGGSTVTLTRGNGSRNAITILGEKGQGLDLEILARGTRTVNATIFTRVASAVLALVWICLLITVAGMKQRTWYLLGIGLLGTLQNVIAGGAKRKPDALGVHLTPVETIRGPKVAGVLKKVEEKYPGVGTSLLDVFFPGSLRVKDPEELAFWKDALEARVEPNKFGTRVDQA